MRLFVALILATITGTALPADQSKESKDNKLQAKVYRMEWVEFCLALGKNLRKPTVENMRLRELLEERATRNENVTKADLYAISTGQAPIGSGLCTVAAAYGRATRVNRTVTKYGESLQLVYESPRRYVHLDNGIVTAISD